MKFKLSGEGFSQFLISSLKIKLRKEFVFIFFKKEGKALLGKGLTNFWFLIIIFFLTFLAIGFANGSLKYLSEKMANPFVRWVTIQVPYGKSEKIELIMKELAHDTADKKKYKYNSITGYNFISLYFWDDRKNMSKSAYGRSIETNDPLLSEIMDKKNLVEGFTFKGNSDIGLIVTERLLRTFHYDPSASFIYMVFGDAQDDRNIALPIRAIVKELPGNTEFLVTPYFYDQRFIDVESGGNPFLPSRAPGISMLVETGSKKLGRYTEKLQKFLNSRQDLKPYGPFVCFQPCRLVSGACSQIMITLWNDTSLNLRDRIYGMIEKNEDLQDVKYHRFYDYTGNLADMSTKPRQYDRISVEFLSLDEIKEFKTFLAKKYEIDIDMAQVESLDNYNFVTKLTMIICIILMVFSILSICLFISNLLKNHLEKIKMNIGTFLAFGIDYLSLERIYLTIIYMVMLVSMSIGIIAAWLIGYYGTIRIILLALKIKVEENETYFEQFTYWTYILLGFILIISYFVIKKITNRIFKQTPGDLLYDRV